jgi:hypothetical protein
MDFDKINSDEKPVNYRYNITEEYIDGEILLKQKGTAESARGNIFLIHADTIRIDVY